jgi:hypothetical protein
MAKNDVGGSNILAKSFFNSTYHSINIFYTTCEKQGSKDIKIKEIQEISWISPL